MVVDLFDYVFFILLITVLFLLPVCFLGKSLPVWIFLNTLQLVAHMLLLNSSMPGNLHQFLIKYNDLVRLQSHDETQRLDEYFGAKRPEYE